MNRCFQDKKQTSKFDGSVHVLVMYPYKPCLEAKLTIMYGVCKPVILEQSAG